MSAQGAQRRLYLEKAIKNCAAQLPELFAREKKASLCMTRDAVCFFLKQEK